MWKKYTLSFGSLQKNFTIKIGKKNADAEAAQSVKSVFPSEEIFATKSK